MQKIWGNVFCLGGGGGGGVHACAPLPSCSYIHLGVIENRAGIAASLVPRPEGLGDSLTVVISAQECMRNQLV